LDNPAIVLFKESEETFEAAKLLFENGYYGDSINRVYYVMFYVAKALLAEKDIFPKTHKGTINMFSKEFVKTGIIKIEIFRLLTKSQDDRQKADYDLFTTFAKNKTKKALENAGIFINECLKHK
jgi:uncharacterized protein (UPF0332 family)